MKHLDRHHRRCRSNGGTNEASNISIVDSKKHRAWHTLFKNMTTAEIVEQLNTVWCDSHDFIICYGKDQIGLE